MGSTVEKTNRKIKRTTPVQYLKGVGPARAEVFARLGVRTVTDLLEFYPRDWVFAPEPVKISQMQQGKQVTIVGLIESTDYQSFRNPPIFEVIIADETAPCRMVWFHGGYLRNRLQVGQVLVATGKVSVYKHQIQLTNPKFTTIDEKQPDAGEHFSGGVYPATGRLSSIQIKRIIRPVLDQIQQLVDEFFDKQLLKQANLINRPDAFRWIHLPPDQEKLAQAKKRLKYDELFLMQAGLALRRHRNRNFAAAHPMTCSRKIDTRIRRRFPFLLTEDQNRVIEEIVNDMGDSKPMNRLLQGDVGSGKTVVALYAALLAVANKKQVAIMAPTEVLAEQHYLSIERYLKNSKVRTACLTGGVSGKKRSLMLERIKKGSLDIVVGTVALIQADVEFRDLGLVIIDEQHKFGVVQRAALRKETTPHCLVMTATPIPRTLAMTAFGDLDVSVIKHSPPGRGSIITRWVDKADRNKAYDFIRHRLKAGKQAYFVYPQVAGSGKNIDVKAATDEYEHLAKHVFPEFKVSLLHGRMPSKKKQKIMSDFRNHKVDLLVSTVVIEVGVDVPNATIMVVETSDRFGLAQLHQLRGRIGRGHAKSYCLLFSDTANELARSRLEVMTRCNDGFEIAEHDLSLRGPGELFSTRQHGLPDLKIANIIDDYQLVVMARKNAFELISKDPMLTKSEHKNIRRSLLDKFGDALGLADVA